MDKIKYIVIIILIYLVITNIYTFNKQYFTTPSLAPSQINLSPSLAPSLAPSIVPSNTIASALLKLKTAPKLTSLVIQTSSGSETVQCMGSCNKCVLSAWTPSGCTVTEAT
jgi:hypothetical protein